METEIRCPRCGSTQITANKKGFSGKKAVAGAVLTGGIGLLAGTIGSKKVIITCLSCGKEFRPGQGAAVPVTNDAFNQLGDFDKRVIVACNGGKQMLQAVSLVQKEKGMKLVDAKNYVEKIMKDAGMTLQTSNGCGAVVILLLLSSMSIIGVFLMLMIF
jgi:DNA-directed RNA polymerase subunit RPC12/RpoP